MAEINFETRKFYSTVVVFLFFINVSIIISNFIDDYNAIGFSIFFSLLPCICFLINYFSKDSRDPRYKPQDQENSDIK